MRTVDAEYKLEKNIKIAMLYLEDDDAVNAETFIKKAASLITGTKVSCLTRTMNTHRLMGMRSSSYMSGKI